MKVFLTGGSGFIGSHVVEKLLARRDHVRLLIRPHTLQRPGIGRQLKRSAHVEIIAGDLTDTRLLTKATRDVEVVYHLAWQGVPKNLSFDIQDRSNLLSQANVIACERLLQASAENGVRRFLFTSSVAVYGPPESVQQFPIDEDATLMQHYYPNNSFPSYADSKIRCENLLRSYARKCDFEYVILRPSIVYGVGAPFAERLVKRILNTQPLAPDYITHDIQMVHVSDMAKAVVLAGTKLQAGNREINIAGSETVSSLEIDELIRAAAGDLRSRHSLALRGTRPTTFRLPRYDLTRAKSILTFLPRVRLQDGIAEMVTATLNQPSHRSDVQIKYGNSYWRNAQARQIRDFYDQRLDSDLLDEYFEHSDFWNFGYRIKGTESPRLACEQLMEKLLGFIPQKRGTILDVACGKGATTRYLRKFYTPRRVVGINNSPDQVKVCLKNAPGCTFRVMDATRLEFPRGAFDNIVCVEAAMHFDTRVEFLREANRVLKPDGRLVLSDAIMPPWSKVQPVANYVGNLDSYKQRCLNAGFAEVNVFDATRSCWESFSRDLMSFAWRKLQANEIEYAEFRRIATWLQRLGPECYLLAVCLKR